jgi:hypothetical protein
MCTKEELPLHIVDPDLFGTDVTTEVPKFVAPTITAVAISPTDGS